MAASPKPYKNQVFLSQFPVLHAILANSDKPAAISAIPRFPEPLPL
jgi:hypothetical protein